MKLHAVDRMLPVPHPHDQTVAPGRHLKAIGKRFTTYNEGVIASGLDWIAQAIKNAVPVVLDHGGLSVHELVGTHHFTTVNLSNSLVPQTDPQDGEVRPQFPDDLTTHPRFVGSAGAWRNTDAFRGQFTNLLHRHLVVAVDLHLCAQLAKKLLADGAIGELNHIYCYMDGGKPDPSWRSENEGPLLHDFTHYFDLMDLYGGPVSWLCGMAEQRWRPWAVEDMTGALVKFVGGATGSIYGAELSVYGDNGFELRGRTGVIRMLAEQVHLWQSEQGMYEPDSGFQ